MTLVDAALNSPLRVLSFSDDITIELNDLQSRLIHLGFCHGEIVKLMKRAPLFKEPYLVEVRGRMIAMSKSEAALIDVEPVT